MDLVIEVVTALPIFRTFHYRVPPPLQKNIRPGLRVLVPVGLRSVTGYVLRTVASSDHPKLKEVLSILDERPLFPPPLLHLFEWMAHYYHHPLGKVIEGALPAGLNVSSRRLLTITEIGHQAREERTSPPEILSILGLFPADKPVSALAIEKKFPGASRNLVPPLVDEGLLAWKEIIRPPRTRLKEEQWVGPTEKKPSGPLTKNEEALLTHLCEQGAVPLKALKATPDYKVSTLKRLEKCGLVSIRKAIAYRDPVSAEILCYRRPAVLTVEQEQAIKSVTSALGQDQFSTYVLHGVTGSGKTEVYLGATEAALARGKDCIVLAPEIALTAYLEAAFTARFGDKVAVLHSGLSSGEKFDQWMRILDGKACIALGARSAVFAPFSSLGLIIVDEEHDSSYKQEDTLRYQGRDVAVMRASLENAVAMLGSATPSIQSTYNVRSGRYRYLSLTKRIEDRPLPDVYVIDMRQPEAQSEAYKNIFSAQLLRAIEENLQRREQTLVFLNRRGFSPFMQCTACGHVLTCPNCSVSLTHHRSQQVLLCHYCGYSNPALTICPACKGFKVKSIGWGTERIEAELKSLFPKARIARLDRDTTSPKRGQHHILKAVHKKEIDILVGTQMITKGHHFPDVTVVGVVSADQSLNRPDFRAAERNFQLLAQVAGRAGRGEKPGRVFIQTYNPGHYSIVKAKEHDFPGYYEEEITLRKALGYPPLVRLIALVSESNSQTKANQYALEMSQRARTLFKENSHWLESIEVLGPAPAPLFKVRGKFRYQMLLKGLRVEPLHAYLSHLLGNLRTNPPLSGVKLVVDVDPESML